MNIKDFIYQQAGFNDCSFCKTFGLNQKCPIRENYKNKENPEKKEIEENCEKCKQYVITNLTQLLINQ